MDGKNSAYTKQYNRQRVLGLLRRQPTSRAELSRQMGLTRAAISLIAEELMAEGLIRESVHHTAVGGPGRTPTMLKICEGARYAVGVSLRRSGCEVGIGDLAGGLLARQNVAGQGVEAVADAIRRLLRETAVPAEKLLGIGIAAPGPVDAAAGKILNPPDFPGWENCPVCEYLSRELGLPAYLENDANAAAMYNFMDHDFAGKENFLLLFVDCGVGSGVISQGRVLRSLGGFTCELGHTSIDFRGPKCSCGNRGCLERYASIDRLTEEFGCGSWEELMCSGDRDRALDREAEYLAAAIVNFANVVHVDAVLLGGRLQTQSQGLLTRIAERVAGRTLARVPIRILPALYNEESYVRSACSVAFCRFLEIG